MFTYIIDQQIYVREINKYEYLKCKYVTLESVLFDALVFILSLHMDIFFTIHTLKSFVLYMTYYVYSICICYVQLIFCRNHILNY